MECDIPKVGLPRIVQSLQLLFRPLEFLTSCIKTYGPVFELSTIGRQRTLYPVVDTGMIAELHDQFPDVQNDEVKVLFGESALLCTAGAVHKKHRSILAQFFRANRIDQAKLADHIRADVAALRGNSPTNQIVGLAIGNSVIDTVFKQFIFQGATDQQWRKIDGIVNLLQRSMRPVTTLEAINIPTLRRIFDPYYRNLHRNFIKLDIIIEEIVTEDPDGDSLIPFLARNGLSTSEIRGFLLEICASTSETLLMGLLWSLYFLATEKREWEALKAAAKKTQQADMIDRFVKEVLRLRPVTMLYDRHVSHDAVIGGFRFRSGGRALFIPYHLHQRTFDDPLTFNSDRFAQSMPQKYSYMPFGSGLRYCLGGYLAQNVMHALISAILDHDHFSRVGTLQLQRYHLRYLNLAPSLSYRYVLA